MSEAVGVSRGVVAGPQRAWGRVRRGQTGGGERGVLEKEAHLFRGGCPSQGWAQLARYPGFLREVGSLDFCETFPI